MVIANTNLADNLIMTIILYWVGWIWALLEFRGFCCSLIPVLIETSPGEVITRDHDR